MKRTHSIGFMAEKQKQKQNHEVDACCQYGKKMSPFIYSRTVGPVNKLQTTSNQPPYCSSLSRLGLFIQKSKF